MVELCGYFLTEYHYLALKKKEKRSCITTVTIFAAMLGLFERNLGNFTPLGILQHPTLIWFRNLKRRNIRPYPIKLWRICMHQEKSGFVICICDIVLNKQACGQRHRLQTSITELF